MKKKKKERKKERRKKGPQPCLHQLHPSLPSSPKFHPPPTNPAQLPAIHSFACYFESHLRNIKAKKKKGSIAII